VTDRNDRILREFVQLIDDGILDDNTSSIIQQVLKELCLRFLEGQE